MSVLEVEGLTVTAGTLQVVREVSLTVPRGKVVGLVGESGAGKSMIGRVLAGALPQGFAVSAGRALFEGRDLLALSSTARRSLLGGPIAFIPQEPQGALSPLQTVEKHFGETFARLGVPRGQRGARMAEALGSVGLDRARVAKRYPFQLSGGMCQRVLIALAFVGGPRLVIADEPTTALDVSTEVRIVALIRALQAREGTGLVFITHDLRLAAHVCDRVVVLYAGEVVETGPAGAVMGDPRHPYTRSLKASIPPLSGPIRRLAPLGGTMPSLGEFARLPGCRFAPRCSVADPHCLAQRPHLVEVAPEHHARAAAGCLSAKDAASGAPPPAPPAQLGEPVLELRGLEKRYLPPRDLLGLRRGAATVAVASVDLTVRAGEFVGIVGESGSGKSTLARLAMGLEAPSAGCILVEGVDVSEAGGASRSLRLGALQMVFQDPHSALNPRRSVASLVTQPLEPRRALSSAMRRARAHELLAATGLPEALLQRLPGQLSGGQRQRVNLARALCVAPKLLIADEIVSGLDVSVQAQILNLLLELREVRGIALLLISHDLAVVRYLCSRVLVMQAGEVVEEGPVEEVFAEPQHPYTRSLIASIPPDDPSTPWPPTPASAAPAQGSVDVLTLA